MSKIDKRPWGHFKVIKDSKRCKVKEIVVNNNNISLSAIALDGRTMSNFTFKGNRVNLFG